MAKKVAQEVEKTIEQEQVKEVEKLKEQQIIELLEAAKELCVKCAEERRKNGYSITRVSNIGRLLNEHIKTLKPLINDY